LVSVEERQNIREFRAKTIQYDWAVLALTANSPHQSNHADQRLVCMRRILTGAALEVHINKIVYPALGV
jgi:hypothetical protein